MVPRWHAFIFLCILITTIHVTILPIIDILKDLESNEDPNGPKDVYDNICSAKIFPHQDMFVKVIAKKRY
jgi:hypothetical protein